MGTLMPTQETGLGSQAVVLLTLSTHPNVSLS
jgi:hypothetical protein